MDETKNAVCKRTSSAKVLRTHFDNNCLRIYTTITDDTDNNNDNNNCTIKTVL